MTIGYAVGHYNALRKPFYLIGTPIDPAANNNEENRTGAQPDGKKSLAGIGQPSAYSTDRGAAMCGARTISGKPCRRKVAGGGYCWQHRDKYVQKKNESNNK
ncbi:MAG TPA: hypothetical protein VJZ26_08630 [Blastocatellia bacterium]|nr:hypothetical protein [Blastocatellia bacterium]